MNLIDIPHCYILKDDSSLLMRLSEVSGDTEEYTWYINNQSTWVPVSNTNNNRLEDKYAKLYGKVE